jgi:hypothetical protein
LRNIHGMPIRTIIEWRCARCGDEEAIEQGKPHGWSLLPGLSHYQGNPRSEPHIGGDVCPRCAASFQDWWQRRPAAKPPVRVNS